jgi:hypothetical protein
MSSVRKSAWVNAIFAIIGVKVAILLQIPKYLLTAWIGRNQTVEDLVFGDYGSTLVHVILNGLLIRGPVEFFIFGFLAFIFALIRPSQRNLPRTIGIGAAVFAGFWLTMNFVMAQIKFFVSWEWVAYMSLDFAVDLTLSVGFTVAGAVIGGRFGARLRS